MRDRSYPWEFGYVVDQDRHDTGFAVIRGRIGTPALFAQLQNVARDHRVIGITCQGVFPLRADGPASMPVQQPPLEGRDEPYVSMVEGWAHCFRDPDRFLPPDRPRILFSNSDNIVPDRVWRTAHDGGAVSKRWDVVYSCLAEETNVIRKNWEFAKRCCLRLAEELGLRVLIIGRAGTADPPDHPLIELTPQLPWSECLKAVAGSHVAFFPNTWDPSPRLIAEALCLDVPVIVNRDILGGWKYVDAATGLHMGPDDDIVDVYSSVRKGEWSPADWYRANYGYANSGPRLAKFVNDLAAERGTRLDCHSAMFFSPRDWGRLPTQRPPSAAQKPAAQKPAAQRPAAPGRRPIRMVPVDPAIDAVATAHLRSGGTVLHQVESKLFSTGPAEGATGW